MQGLTPDEARPVVDRIEIDARGHRCPVPTLRLQRALARAPPGAVAALLADDPLARVDVALFARSKGYRLLSQQDLAGGAGRSAAVLFLVQKPSDGDEDVRRSTRAGEAVRSPNLP